MDDDLRRGLLSKKGGFEKMYEDGLIRVAKIRQQNDAFQKQCGPDIDEELRQQIERQSSYIQRQITELRNLLNQMENKYRDPESKNKIKQLKGDAQKQIERNKIILKDVIRQSFERRSFGKGNEEDSSQFIQGGAVDYDHLNGLNGSSAKRPKNEKESLLTDPPEAQQEEQQQITIDYEVERKMMLEKNAMMDEVEQKTQMINQIINEQGIMVEEQGQNLDVISQELVNINKNLTQTNQNLEDATRYQRKSRKKYVILVIVIIMILIIVAGVVFFMIK